MPAPHILIIWCTTGWDLLASLRHPCKFQWVSHLGSITARHSTSGHQPNFAALNRGRHLYLAGRPSRWELAHISSSVYLGRWPDLINWNSVLIWYVGRPHLDMCTSLTSTRSKVKIKVTELLKFWKLHFSRSISSTSLVRSSKLMGPSLQLVGARFLNFLLSKLSRDFKRHSVDIAGLSKGRISLLL